MKKEIMVIPLVASSGHQRRKFSEDGIDQFRLAFGNELRIPCSPVKAADLIGQDDALHGQIRRKHHFEGIALLPARNRKYQREADQSVVRGGRNNQRRPSPRLLVTRLRIEVNPD